MDLSSYAYRLNLHEHGIYDYFESTKFPKKGNINAQLVATTV